MTIASSIFLNIVSHNFVSSKTLVSPKFVFQAYNNQDNNGKYLLDSKK